MCVPENSMANGCLSTVKLPDGKLIACRREPWPTNHSLACHTHHPDLNEMAVRRACWAMLNELRLVAERRANPREKKQSIEAAIVLPG